MIKADVEGWELDLLRGAEKLLAHNMAPILCVEYSESYSPSRERLPGMYDFVRSINHYELYKLKHGKETISPLVRIDRREALPRHDNLFCFLPSHRLEIGSKLFP